MRHLLHVPLLAPERWPLVLEATRAHVPAPETHRLQRLHIAACIVPLLTVKGANPHCTNTRAIHTVGPFGRPEARLGDQTGGQEPYSYLEQCLKRVQWQLSIAYLSVCVSAGQTIRCDGSRSPDKPCCSAHLQFGVPFTGQIASVSLVHDHPFAISDIHVRVHLPAWALRFVGPRKRAVNTD